MADFIILYRIESIMASSDDPFGFACRAGSSDEAEDQFLDNTVADIVWVFEGNSYDAALKDYYTVGMPE